MAAPLLRLLKWAAPIWMMFSRSYTSAWECRLDPERNPICIPTGDGGNEKQIRAKLFTLLTVSIITFATFASETHAAIAFEQTVGQNVFYDPVNYTGTTNVAVTSPVAAGNSIIVTIAMEWWDETTPTACSDSKSNTYTLDATATNGGADNPTFICSAHNVTALTTSDTITITHSGTDSRAVTVHEFSGLAASATLDKTVSGEGWGTAPSSGSTTTTAQADELLIGSISTAGPISQSFTAGAGYTVLAREGTDGSGAWDVTVNPEYRIVSATGSYAADGTLSPAELWAAAIATYKAASGTTITLSGTLYSGEGTGPVSGQTVRLVVEGASVGTDTTDTNGDYSITATINPTYNIWYIPLLVYVDDGTVDATTVTAMDSTINSATISDLDLYTDHLITRQDEGSTPLDTGDMDNAKVSYSDADILYSISWPDTMVTGANTELYIPNGHSYTPFGNVTTTHMQIEGTLTGGSHTFYVAGDWEITNGTFNYDTSTVDFTGSGTISNDVSAWWVSTGHFYNVNAAAGGQTTTILAGRGIVIRNILTLGTGTVAGGAVILNRDGGTPLVTSGATLSNSNFKYSSLTNPVNITSTSYPELWIASNDTSVFTLLGDISCNFLRIQGNGPNDQSTLDTASHSITCNRLRVGGSSNDRYGKLLLNNSVVTVNGNVNIYPSNASGANEIDAGSATINVSGDWTNNDIFTQGTSSVILNGTGQQLQGNTTFYDLTKTVTSADTLIFTAGTTQTVTGTATLNGAGGQLLSLRSSTSPTRWNFNLATGATKAISYVNVQDSDASGSDSSLIEINPTYSTDSGNNVSWFGGATITVVKSSEVISDPINGTSFPKRIPGAVVEYTILVTNTAGAQATNVTVTDDLSTESARLNFAPNGYDGLKGIQVTAPNINGGTALDLTNAADSDQGDYGATTANTVTVGAIILDAGEQATVRFRVAIQ